jgi:hypothetical protein
MQASPGMTSRRMCQHNPIEELSMLPELRQERAPLLLHQDSSVRTNKS